MAIVWFRDFRKAKSYVEKLQKNCFSEVEDGNVKKIIFSIHYAKQFINRMTKRFSTHSFAQMFAQQRFKVGHLSFKSLE